MGGLKSAGEFGERLAGLRSAEGIWVSEANRIHRVIRQLRLEQPKRV